MPSPTRYWCKDHFLRLKGTYVSTLKTEHANQQVRYRITSRVVGTPRLCDADKREVPLLLTDCYWQGDDLCVG